MSNWLREHPILAVLIQFVAILIIVFAFMFKMYSQNTAILEKVQSKADTNFVNERDSQIKDLLKTDFDTIMKSQNVILDKISHE